MLLGLTLAACGGDKDSDSTTTPAGTAQPLYGTTTTQREAPAKADLPDYVEAVRPQER